MATLYVTVVGLFGIEPQNGAGSHLLLLKTYPDDQVPGMGMPMPIPAHIPQVELRRKGAQGIETISLTGDVALVTAQGGALAGAGKAASDLSRLPSLPQVLQHNGGKGQNVVFNPAGAPRPRVAARLHLAGGALSHLDVDENRIPVAPAGEPWDFLSLTNFKHTLGLKLKVADGVLFRMDIGTQAPAVEIAGQTIPLERGGDQERAALGKVPNIPQDFYSLRVTNLPAPDASMKMDLNTDFHFALFYDLFPSYAGERFVPTRVKPAGSLESGGQGDPPFSRCIPPRLG
jgi:hypothetical protein